MVMFGKQIASTGKIYDFTESNDLWEEIQSLELDWNVWKEKYQTKRNNLLSEFRLIAPK
jgi:hypothetical protein